MFFGKTKQSPEEGPFLKHLFTYCEQISILQIVFCCMYYSASLIHTNMWLCQVLWLKGIPETKMYVSASLRLTVALLHRDKEVAYCCCQQQVNGLVEQLGWKDAPYEEVVPQNSDQHNVGCSWHGPQQGQTVAAVANSNWAPEDRGRTRQNIFMPTKVTLSCSVFF